MRKYGSLNKTAKIILEKNSVLKGCFEFLYSIIVKALTNSYCLWQEMDLLEASLVNLPFNFHSIECIL